MTGRGETLAPGQRAAPYPTYSVRCKGARRLARHPRFTRKGLSRRQTQTAPNDFLITNTQACLLAAPFERRAAVGEEAELAQLQFQLLRARVLQGVGHVFQEKLGKLLPRALQELPNAVGCERAAELMAQLFGHLTGGQIRADAVYLHAQHGF